MHHKRFRFLSGLSVALLLIVLSTIFYHKTIRKFPAYTHAWAQSDRYALAIGFTENGFNFFKPETHNLNPQFPAKVKLTTAKGITAVDFPVHEYLIALIMKITGSTSPAIFRIYILLYSLVGLFFLYLFVIRYSGSVFKSLIIITFAFTAPVFTYYQAGFLPSIPSIANAFIAYYFYLEYVADKKIRDFVLSILFLTLATLVRTPFVIFLAAVLLFDIWIMLTSNEWKKAKLLTIAISGLAIIGYFIYNSYLRYQYGSIFLSNPLPAENLSEFTDILLYIKENWLFQYFSEYHFILFAGVLLMAVPAILKSRAKQKKSIPIEFFLKFQILVTSILVSIFATLMIKQFKHHDYYFLDTFYLIFVFGLIYLLKKIILKKRLFIILSGAIALIFCGLFIRDSLAIQRERYTPKHWDRQEITRQNFIDSPQLLQALNIEEKAKILVIDAYSPNTPFILMGRKGYAVLTTSRENIVESLTWNYDYVVMQDEFIPEVVINFPEINRHVQRLGGNGKISIFSPDENNRPKDLSELLGLKDRNTIYNSQLYVSDTTANTQRNNKAQESTGVLTSDQQFFNLATIDSLYFEGKSERLITIEGMFYSENEINDLFLVASISSPEYYKSINFINYLKNNNEWEELSFIFPIPGHTNDYRDLKVYFWNTSGQHLVMKNIAIKIY